LPCGVDTVRFRPIPRRDARAALGLDPDTPCLLFPADPSRPGKRYDRALALARACGGAPPSPRPAPPASGGSSPRRSTPARGDARPPPRTAPRAGTPTHPPLLLHTLGGVPPEQVPLWVNAANAVLVPSTAEGFGLAVLEALACDVPVLATPVGVHTQALAGVAGALCAPFELERWRAAAAPHLANPDPRISGRVHAEPFAAAPMAERLAQAWRELLARRAR
jgi:teichuronic acid biosynthesis glycosyltransferase TuaC